MSAWALITWTCLASLAAGYVGGCFRSVSEFSRMRKLLRDTQRTVADLESSFDALMESHKRLRSRAGMREYRDREMGAKALETKADARRRIFGSAMGPAAAKIVQGMSSGRNKD